MDLQINNTALPMAIHPKVLVLTPTPTHRAHTFTTSQYTHTHFYKKHSPQQDEVNRRRYSWLPTRQT